MEEGRFPLIGDKFPELEVETTQGTIKLPDKYKDKWFMIFSHPGDFTPVCTTEFYSFTKRYEDFLKLGVELIGLSVDSTISHIEWINWIEDHLKVKVPFPIIGDSLGTIAKKLGMIHTESSTTAVRAVFIVDSASIVRLIMYYPLEIGRNVDEILRAIKALQVNTKYKVALPANWPNSELLEDKAIVPAPKNVADARSRLEQYKGFAWWLTYKELPSEEVQEARKFAKKKE